MNDQLTIDGGESLLPPVAVTTGLDAIINPGEALLQWAWNQGRDGRPLRSHDDRMRGLDVHRLMQRLAAGHAMDDREYPENQQDAARNLADWWALRQPEVIAVERKVRSETLGWSGVLDLVAHCTGCETCEGLPDGGAEIIDLKVTGSRRVRARWHFQVGSVYRALWDSLETGVPSCRGTIVVIPAGLGRAREHPALGSPRDAATAIAWSRAVSRVQAAQAAVDAGVTVHPPT